MGSERLNKVVLLDVRTIEEYFAGHIPRSVCIPLDQLEERLNELNKEKSIVVYCKSGCNRSQKAVQILSRHGFKQVKNIPGGINEWYRIGGEIVGNGQKKDEDKAKECPVWELGHGCED